MDLIRLVPCKLHFDFAIHQPLQTLLNLNRKRHSCPQLLSLGSSGINGITVTNREGVFIYISLSEQSARCTFTCKTGNNAYVKYILNG